MLSLNDIKHKRFQKASLRGGYMREEVDDFLEEVEASYGALIQKTAEQHDELERRKAEISHLKDRIRDLEDQLKQYQAEEDEIKEALVSAQRMRDAAVREARRKAETTVQEAQKKAQEIVTHASREILGQQEKLRQIKQAVTEFRTTLLGLYKEHITLINDLPHQELPEQPAAPAPEPEPAAAAPQPEPKPAAPAEAVKTSEPEVEPVVQPATFVGNASAVEQETHVQAKPFAPVEPAPQTDFGEDYDLDEDDATRIFSKRHR